MTLRSLFLWALPVIALLASLSLGSSSVGPGDVLALLSGNGSDEARFVMTELRFPRTAIGIVVGLALGISGALLQSLTRNPLAEPGLLGVSAGSALAVTVMILMGSDSAAITTPVAQVGALAGCGLVVAVARMQGPGRDPVRLILAGATLSGLLLSLTSLIMMADQRTADEIRFWVTGSISGRQWEELFATLPSMALAGLTTALVARPLASMALGEHVAVGLGYRPGRVQFLVIITVALFVGAATALAGPLMFLGLAVPFIARAIGGPDIRRTLLLCLAVGPTVLLLADTLCRLLVAPSELPLGVTTALLGAPLMVMIVRRQKMPTL